MSTLDTSSVHDTLCHHESRHQDGLDDDFDMQRSGDPGADGKTDWEL